MNNFMKGTKRIVIASLVLFGVPVIIGYVFVVLGLFKNIIKDAYPNGINIGSFWQIGAVVIFIIFMVVMLIIFIDSVGSD